MPNLILNYTANVGTHLEVPLLLKDLHDALIGLGIFKTHDIKTRALEADVYRVGDGASQYGFVHLEVHMMSIHTPEKQQLIGETLVAVLVSKLRPGLDPVNGQIRVEIIPIDPATYFSA